MRLVWFDYTTLPGYVGGLAQRAIVMPTLPREEGSLQGPVIDHGSWFFEGSLRMRKRLLTTAAALLVTTAAYGQVINPNYPGSGTDITNNPLNYPSNQSNALDCTDPLMATSPLCRGTISGYSGLGGGGFGGGQPFSSQLPGLGQGQMMTYTDDRGQLTRRERSLMIPLPPEPLTEFQKFTSATTGMLLPIFGASLFQSVPSTFAPLDNAPVPPDYVIGPDDEVRMRVWGQVNFNANLRVDRSGTIYVPQVGAVDVAGTKFSDLDQTLRKAVGKIYRNFEMTVQLGQIRAIQIYVTGEARRPGMYTVSSLSTLVDALFASGGPSVQGSMRQIEVRRAGAVVTTFDLYRLLIAGDKSKDTKLQPSDVIFVPQVGPQAAVLGSVRRPAIYELLPGETVGDVLKYAGNATSLATDVRASLDRNMEHTGRQAMEVRLDTTGLATPLKDGDILRVISIVSKYQNTVTLRGNVANPGRFAWHSGMKLSDLIPDKESLITRDYWWKRVRLGLPTPEFEPVPAFSGLRQPANPVDLPLEQSLQGRRNAQQALNAAAQAQNPNSYQAQAQAMNQATMQNPDLNMPDYYWNTTEEGASPYEALNPANNQGVPGQGAANQQPGAGAAGQQQTGPRGSESALAEPETQTPQQINPQATRRTVVRLSAPEIDWSYAVIERMDPATLKTTLIPFDLGKLVLQHDASQDVELQAGDMVSIFSQSDIHVPIAEQTSLVRLEGEVAHAGTYSARPGDTLRTLVERAGGMTPNAYLYGSVFTRESTRVLQQRRMDEAVQRMILQMQRGALSLASSGTSSPQDVASAGAAQASSRELITQLQQIRATGRIVFGFKPESKSIDEIPDIPLENGDTFLIPPMPSTVNAVGAVFNQNSFLFRPDARVDSYLALAGGPNADADKKHMFLVKANGAVIAKESVKSAWGNDFDRLKLNPGDTIVVPDKAIKPSALRSFMYLSTFFSQLMYGIAATTVVF
jgi:protein involved in polysaccharide export with SLBB domain